MLQMASNTTTAKNRKAIHLCFPEYYLIPASIRSIRRQDKNGDSHQNDSVAHHKTVEEPAFRERIAGFEVFISTRLKPRPTEDFAAIDALVEED